MSKKILILLSFLLLQVTSYRAIAAIGDWKAYMAYSEVQEIEQAGNLIFVQASNNLYVYNQNDQSIQTFSKMDYLSDCGIQHIAYNKAAKRLLIFYSNANMDLMNISNYDVQNLSDYYSASTTGDKAVNDIYMYGKYAYMSNGFGIIKVNMADGEISDTYNLGFKVNWCEIKDSHIYAYSQTNGQYSALLTSNLLDKNNWSKVGGYVAKKQEDKSALKQIVGTLQPGGPKYNYFGFLKFTNGQLYTCGGNVGGQRNACIQILNNDNWFIYQDDNISQNTGVGYKDIVCLDYNPKDQKQVFAGGRNGLYEFYDGKFKNYYNYTNSLIERFDGISKEYELITGVKFDKDGNLWILNSQAPTQSLIEFNTNGEWISHTKSELMKLDDGGFRNKSLGSLENMMIDSKGLLWFVNNHWTIPSLYFYQFSTDTIKAFTTFINEDGTIVNVGSVRTIAEDKNGDIWIGTNVGPLLLEYKEITKESPIFIQVKVPRNDGTNYADYLLNNIDITSIAIDGANRKWFGTKDNGIYLISNNNLEQIQHYTKENSHLLSNEIESMAIDEEKGIIYIGTPNGLCSITTDATIANTKVDKDNVWAYPNPVRPEYSGPITITGLSFDSDIKIVSTNGSLVNQGRSNGGTYTWNGRDQEGRKVSSGIYMVETASNQGEKETVCKIAIIK